MHLETRLSAYLCPAGDLALELGSILRRLNGNDLVSQND